MILGAIMNLYLVPKVPFPFIIDYNLYYRFCKDSHNNITHLSAATTILRERYNFRLKQKMYYQAA